MRERDAQVVHLVNTNPETIAGAALTDVDTGLPITKVFRVLYDASRAGATMTIYRYLTTIDVVSHAEVVTVCPQCRKENMEHYAQMRGGMVDHDATNADTPSGFREHVAGAPVAEDNPHAS